MKVIFLDVDGVIKPLNDSEPLHGFNANCLAWLDKIVQETRAKIVLSTSWRDSLSDMAFLKNGLDRQNGLWSHVIGCTPQLWHLSNSKFDEDEGTFVNPTNDKWSGSRGHEIHEWMKQNSTLVTKAFILDDDPEAAQLKLHDNLIRFGQCDPAVGLNEQISLEAIDFLK